MTLYVSIVDLLSQNGEYLPAHWVCPLQDGLPILLNSAKNVLLYGAAFSFFGGIATSVFGFLMAFGDEEKAKKAYDSLKWTFIGATLFMLSAFLVTNIANAILEPGYQIEIFNFNAPVKDITDTPVSIGGIDSPVCQPSVQTVDPGAQETIEVGR